MKIGKKKYMTYRWTLFCLYEKRIIDPDPSYVEHFEKVRRRKREKQEARRAQQGAPPGSDIQVRQHVQGAHLHLQLEAQAQTQGWPRSTFY